MSIKSNRIEMTYKEYLKTFINSSSPIGDLARDTFSPPRPWTGSTANGLKRHMIKYFNPCREALETWQDSKESYKREVQK